MKVNSKRVVTAVALAALLATPAFAKTRKHQPQQPAAATQGLYNRVDSNAVVNWDGVVIGADPDPSIRAYLLRDDPTRLSGE